MHALAANCEELRARTGNPPLHMHHSQRAARSFVRGLEIRLNTRRCKHGGILISWMKFEEDYANEFGIEGTVEI
jgi:hypothetical protein